MSNVLMACDGNWLVHRAKFGSGDLDDEVIVRTTARMVAAQVFRYAAKHKAAYFFIGFDGPACFRHDVWALYKANRRNLTDKRGNVLTEKERDVWILSGKPLIHVPDIIQECHAASAALCASYGIPVVSMAKYEADDLLRSAGSLIRRPEIKKVVLVSKDKDTFGGLRPGVSQWYPESVKTSKGKVMTDVFITHSDMSVRLSKYVGPEAATWTPLQFRDYQILIGDPTDNIPPILPPKTASKLISRIDSLRAYFETKEGKKFLAQHQEALWRNLQLVNMKEDLFDEFDMASLKYKAPKTLPPNAVPSVTAAMEEYNGLFKILSRPSLFGKK
jgi:5'-3' exonuclease